MTVAVNVCIKRYYRYYVEVGEDAPNEAIKDVARRDLAYMPINELEKYADPDLEVEPDDIEWETVDEGSIPALN